jgi:hypothetical protein
MPESNQTPLIFRQEVWGPAYWFFLMTIALTYPDHANAVTKRKYYDLLHNFPLFMPDQEMGNEFSRMLDKYPVTPYLDYRESFIKWVIFIHNRINVKLGKPEITEEEALDHYFKTYVKSHQHDNPLSHQSFLYEWRKYFIFLLIIGLLIGLVYYLYHL